MLFDMDIFIWVQRGNLKAAALIDSWRDRYVSVYSYMEFLQAAKNKEQHRNTIDFVASLGFVVFPLSETIGHRALMSEVCLASHFCSMQRNIPMRAPSYKTNA